MLGGRLFHTLTVRSLKMFSHSYDWFVIEESTSRHVAYSDVLARRLSVHIERAVQR